MEETRGFHFVFRPWRILIGLLFGVGYMILLQQYGIMTISVGKLVMFGLLGIVIGIALPTLATLIPRRERKRPSAAAMPPEAPR